jgi:hypothetical protein
MTNVIGVVLLVVGIVGLLLGYQESRSAREQTASLFLGRYTQKTLMLLIGGAVAALFGLILLL